MSGRVGAALIAVGLALGALAIGLGDTRSPDLLRAGVAAPGFRLPVLGGGDPLALEDLRGKVVLINFWATWCKPCEDEMPAMERLYAGLAGADFELLAVSVDETSAPVEAFRERLGLSFPILLDPERRVSDAYQAYRFPETWLIDGQGTLVARFIGPREWDAPAYRAQIEALLGSPAG